VPHPPSPAHAPRAPLAPPCDAPAGSPSAARRRSQDVQTEALRLMWHSCGHACRHAHAYSLTNPNQAPAHLVAAGALAHVVLVALGDHQVARVVRAHVQARDHALGQAVRAACRGARAAGRNMFPGALDFREAGKECLRVVSPCKVARRAHLQSNGWGWGLGSAQIYYSCKSPV